MENKISLHWKLASWTSERAVPQLIDSCIVNVGFVV